MLSVPKQQSHKRELPSVLEGNKQNKQHGPMTTFKNWASEVQIYMSLEDHNMATILEDIKTQKHPIVDVTTVYMNKDLFRKMRTRSERKSLPNNYEYMRREQNL
eukprot:4154472-Amphidinium_carterae.1